MKMRKIYNPATCLSAFRNWVTCHKRSKSTEVKKNVIIEQNTSEEKTKGAVMRKPTLSAKCKVSNVSLAHTLTK